MQEKLSTESGCRTSLTRDLRHCRCWWSDRCECPIPSASGRHCTVVTQSSTRSGNTNVFSRRRFSSTLSHSLLPACHAAPPVFMRMLAKGVYLAACAEYTSRPQNGRNMDCETVEGNLLNCSISCPEMSIVPWWMQLDSAPARHHPISRGIEGDPPDSGGVPLRCARQCLHTPPVVFIAILRPHLRKRSALWKLENLN